MLEKSGLVILFEGINVVKKFDEQAIAQQYLDFYRWKEAKPSREARMKEHDARFEVWQYVDRLVRTDPTAAWSITKQLILLAQNDEELSYIAAGPFKDLLHYQPERMRQVLLEEARKNPKMRRIIEYTLVSKGTNEALIVESIKKSLGLT